MRYAVIKRHFYPSKPGEIQIGTGDPDEIWLSGLSTLKEAEERRDTLNKSTPSTYNFYVACIMTPQEAAELQKAAGLPKPVKPQREEREHPDLDLISVDPGDITFGGHNVKEIKLWKNLLMHKVGDPVLPPRCLPSDYEIEVEFFMIGVSLSRLIDRMQNGSRYDLVINDPGTGEPLEKYEHCQLAGYVPGKPTIKVKTDKMWSA